MWIPMSDSLNNKNVCYLDFFFPVIVGYLAFIFEPVLEIPI
jgi:hypothetical protein